MYFPFVLLILCLVVGIVQGEVKLTKGRNETVSFKGEELTIDVDNTLGANAELTLCFGSSPDESRQPCPLGYARFSQGIGANDKIRFIVNRRSQIFKGSAVLSPLGTIKFNDDGTLNIMVVQFPDAKTIVTLPNAEIFVPEKQENAIVKKKRSNVGTVRVLAIIVVLTVVGVIVGVLVWCCVIRTSKPKQTPECNPQDNSLPCRQFCHQKSTFQKPSSKKPIKHVSKTTTTTVQTAVSPKQVAHSRFAQNRTVSKPNLFAVGAKMPLDDTN
uniref:Uncharacterized protein n=1 Tax=Panagrellus redivivus TaxID=6233 RepID=A0A7E4VBI5_PANRE